MSVLAEPTSQRPVRFSAEEAEALTVMADVGLVPSLKLAVGADWVR